MSGALDRQAACPSCGAPVTFRFAGARAVVCKHCKFVVVRTDGGLQAAGRMAELLAIPTPFEVDRTGSWRGEPFQVEGRVQMDRADQASAPWQEILVAFPRAGSHTWVAYAQGRWYATTEVAAAAALPPFETLRPGGGIDLGPHGWWVVQEVGRRRVVSGEGATTGVPAPGAITPYADISAEGARFGTVDYGAGGQPVLYLGAQFDPSEVRFDDGAPLVAPEAAVTAVECPTCGGNLPLMSQAAERIICRYCGTASDVTQGALRALGPAPRPPVQPLLPIGHVGPLRGGSYTVTGFVIRSCRVDGQTYPWREYLLFGGTSVGYRWLMEEDGAWSFVEPVEAGDVRDGGHTATFRGQQHVLAQQVQARIDHVIGEFYWKVEIGETVEATDLTGPAGKLSRERSAQEVTYSLVTPVAEAELRAFGVPMAAGRAAGSGSRNLAFGCLGLLGTLVVLGGTCVAIGQALTHDFQELLDGEVELAAAETQAVKRLLDEAGIAYDSVKVWDDQTSDCDTCEGLVIEDGHVTLMRIERRSIADAGAVVELPRLEVLRLNANKLTRLDGLGKLPRLRWADLRDNQIESVGDLSACANLTRLDLTNNRLTDLGALRGMAALTELHIAGNPLASLAGLDGLPRLQSLTLERMRMTSFEGLGSLPALEKLYAKQVGLTSLAGLDGVPALQELHVPQNELVSLSSVPPLPKLRLIDATDNHVTSIGGLAHLPALKELLLPKNRLTSLDGEGGSASLETLDVSDNNIAAVPTTAPLPALTTLRGNGNQLQELGAIAGLTALTTLVLGQNRLAGVDGVKQLPKLSTLHVPKNQIKSLAPLAGLKLTDLDASDNQLTDVGTFLTSPPAHYNLVGNPALAVAATRRGRYLPSTTTSGSGTYTTTRRPITSGGSSFGGK